MTARYNVLPAKRYYIIDWYSVNIHGNMFVGVVMILFVKEGGKLFYRIDAWWHWGGGNFLVMIHWLTWWPTVVFYSTTIADDTYSSIWVPLMMEILLTTPMTSLTVLFYYSMMSIIPASICYCWYILLPDQRKQWLTLFGRNFGDDGNYNDDCSRYFGIGILLEGGIGLQEVYCCCDVHYSRILFVKAIVLLFLFREGKWRLVYYYYWYLVCGMTIWRRTLPTEHWWLWRQFTPVMTLIWRLFHGRW